MKTIVFEGRERPILTQKEKAEDLGISVHTFWDQARRGMYKHRTVMFPGSTKKWYLKENENRT